MWPFKRKKEDKQPKNECGSTLFRLSSEEEKQLDEFKKKHRHKNGNISYAGGDITISFTPTGIGDVVICRCNICNKEKNITDYDCW